MSILIEQEISLRDLADIIVKQSLGRPDVVFLVEKIADVIADKKFDQEMAELFADRVQSWG